ncbi:hypothetical protein SeMB42_g04143 [Synchytrium endobioticum]|uniref:RRM domain-containing protein n=1 Tax=Synchytrium endobioticum TaxID=286115 RepID=A0A507D0S5_9FUNG|nr:hypothetical protein SeMB42_g04143 [Synchytrium endobioticum]
MPLLPCRGGIRSDKANIRLLLGKLGSRNSEADLPDILTMTNSLSRLPAETDRKLYVGNIDQRCSEPVLRALFDSIAPTTNVKIVVDKSAPTNYGFVEYDRHLDAAEAIARLATHKVHGTPLRVNWAMSGMKTQVEDTSTHFQLFVGDLSEVNDEILRRAFLSFGSLSEARVMWDLSSGKSRGFGFVSYRERDDAQQALDTLNGSWLGNRLIRVSWANEKPAPKPDHIDFVEPLDYNIVVSQLPGNTTAYVGNLATQTTNLELLMMFQAYGVVVELRIQPERGFGFVRLDTHENAAKAIVAIHGEVLHNRTLRCSWGKERAVPADLLESAYPYLPQYPPVPLQLGIIAAAPLPGVSTVALLPLHSAPIHYIPPPPNMMPMLGPAGARLPMSAAILQSASTSGTPSEPTLASSPRGDSLTTSMSSLSIPSTSSRERLVSQATQTTQTVSSNPLESIPPPSLPPANTSHPIHLPSDLVGVVPTDIADLQHMEHHHVVYSSSPSVEKPEYFAAIGTDDVGRERRKSGNQKLCDSKASAEPQSSIITSSKLQTFPGWVHDPISDSLVWVVSHKPFMRLPETRI